MIDDSGHDEMERGPLGIAVGDRVLITQLGVSGFVESVEFVVRGDDGAVYRHPPGDLFEDRKE